jgi:uncharacterized protein
MNRWRVILVAGLLVLPFALLAAVGMYHLWDLGFGLYSWSVMLVSMALGWFLAWRWQRKNLLLRPPSFDTPPHWTDRDAQALQLVKTRAEAAAKLSPKLFTDATFYFNTAQEMAQELAAFYHPGAKDPVSNLTVPEILAVIELAAHDLAQLVEKYLPGGHLMTIRDWKFAKQAADWMQSANKLYWAIATVFNPVDAVMRYTASRVGLSTPMALLQENLLLWFYVAYVERVGHYMIEVNSGRLRVGVKRYMELLEQRLPSVAIDQGQGTVPVLPPPNPVKQVTVTLLGQVKAGKSSLINALLGEQRALTDVLPATNEVERYELKPKDIDTTLVLLDTVGYGHTGPKADQLRTTQEAAKQSDLLLLVLHAVNPARQADLTMLKALKAWFASKPELKHPPVLAVVTHIDLLKPSLEWAPPYHWLKPTRPKEQSIYQALVAVREQMGEYLVGVVPVNLAPGKVYGVDEFLLPAVAAHLDHAHGVALLRVLKAEADTGKIRKVVDQLLATAGEAARIFWHNVTK